MRIRCPLSTSYIPRYVRWGDGQTKVRAHTNGIPQAPAPVSFWTNRMIIEGGNEKKKESEPFLILAS